MVYPNWSDQLSRDFGSTRDAKSTPATDAAVVATTKRDLKAGEVLDGEGGYTVWGKLLRPVRQGQSLSWDDVAVDTATDAYRLRREMEALFAPPVGAKDNGAAIVVEPD